MSNMSIFSSCLVKLLASDLNADGRITMQEYIEFVRLFGFPDNEKVPATITDEFHSLACLCEEFVGIDDPLECCDSESSAILVDIAKQDEEYLLKVCAWTKSSIAITMEAFQFTASPSSPVVLHLQPSAPPSSQDTRTQDAVISASTPGTYEPDASRLSQGAFAGIMVVAAFGFGSFFVFALIFSARQQRRKWIESDASENSPKYYEGLQQVPSTQVDWNGQCKSQRIFTNYSPVKSLPTIAESPLHKRPPPCIYVEHPSQATHDTGRSLQIVADDVITRSREEERSGILTHSNSTDNPHLLSKSMYSPSKNMPVIIRVENRSSPTGEIHCSEERRNMDQNSTASPRNYISPSPFDDSILNDSFQTAIGGSPDSFVTCEDAIESRLDSFCTPERKLIEPSSSDSDLLSNILGHSCDKPESPYRDHSQDSSVAKIGHFFLNGSQEPAPALAQVLTISYSDEGCSDDDTRVVTNCQKQKTGGQDVIRNSSPRNEIPPLMLTNDTWYQNNMFLVPSKSFIDSDEESDVWDGAE